MPENSNGRLVSWKEIAAYLGCDVRTCLRWEKERGLPVHRPGGQPGPRVFAWKHELDNWLARKPKGDAEAVVAPVPIASPTERRSLRRTWALISALIIVVGGLAYFGIRALTMDREPADFHFDGSRLIIINKSGKMLWPPLLDRARVCFDPDLGRAKALAERDSLDRPSSAGRPRALSHGRFARSPPGRPIF